MAPARSSSISSKCETTRARISGRSTLLSSNTKASAAESGKAFVVVLHLASNRKSMLVEIIARWTSRAVSEAVDECFVASNHIYVIPPRVIAKLAEGRLNLRKLAMDITREATPIDTFFDSVAADLGEAGIGVVLSGTGHDGSLGMKAIKARGGLTMAQRSDGTLPQHSGMPNSATATDAVDLIVAVEHMASHVTALSNSKPSLQRLTPVTEINEARLLICEICGSASVMISHYKDKTFLRRVERRMEVLV
jgi:two-component system CheB/CheR fusion protein